MPTTSAVIAGRLITRPAQAPNPCSVAAGGVPRELANVIVRK